MTNSLHKNPNYAFKVWELKASNLALLIFSKMFELQFVRIQAGNMTALSYIKEMGGTHNKEMIALQM